MVRGGGEGKGYDVGNKGGVNKTSFCSIKKIILFKAKLPMLMLLKEQLKKKVLNHKKYIIKILTIA